MQLKESQLHLFFTRNEILRGKNYYKSGYVLELEYEDFDEAIVVNSKVKGSYQSYYEQEIVIEDVGHGVTLSGDCSCPVGHNCKHVYAVCLKLIQQLKTQQAQNPLNRWLREIEVEVQPKKRVSDFVDSEYFLSYRLFYDKSSDLSFFKSKILKNGSISKGSQIKYENFTYGYSFDDVMTDDDEMILKSCLGLVEGYKDIKLQGKLGFLVLKELIATKRAFYKNSTTPLSFVEGEEVAELKWIDEKEGSRLVLDINYPYHILQTKPATIIDISSNTIRLFKSNIESNILSKLLTSPPIPKKMQKDIFLTLQQYTTSIPAPKDVEVKVIEQKPTPKLILYYHDDTRYSFHGMEIRMLYKDIEISPLPKETEFVLTQKDSIIKVKRDLECEYRYERKLLELGFDGLDMNNSLVFLSMANPNMQTALSRWSNFLEEQMPKLQQEGWLVEIDKSFKMDFYDFETVEVQSSEQNEWFSLSFDIEVGGKKQPLVPLISTILSEFDSPEELPKVLNLEVEENKYIKVKTDEVKSVLKIIYELLDKVDDSGDIKLKPFEAHLLDDIDSNIVWKGSKEILELSKKLKDFTGIKKVELPKGLNATLRSYQKDGVNWLNFLYEFRFSGILADDMGLGKTIQTLTHLLRLKELNKLTKPLLIIVPTSLMINWKNESQKFTPDIKILSIYGADRFELFEKIEDFDIVLTTYSLIVRDIDRYLKKEFSYLILDEAQKIKNPKTKMATYIKKLKSEYRLALSGTPVENNLNELWSIFSFLMPGFLDNQSFFKNYYQKPIEVENNIQRQEKLNKRVSPFLLRRTKDVVAKELPKKTEIVRYANFSPKQSKLYESIRITMEQKVRDVIKNKGLNRSHITILDALLKLRQVCCDPSLLKIDEAKKVKDSAKLELLFELLEELLEEGRKILLFSQFTSMLSIIEKEFNKKGIKYSKLTGSTQKREDVINEFTSGKTDVFLISLKAGGVGLNLVEADTVIHYDPWWNPAVENQATDRAYRIGQDKPVFVYKLIVQNTIEQKILELQKKKQALLDGMYQETKDGKTDKKLDSQELLELLK